MPIKTASYSIFFHTIYSVLDHADTVLGKSYFNTVTCCSSWVLSRSIGNASSVLATHQLAIWSLSRLSLH